MRCIGQIIRRNVLQYKGPQQEKKFVAVIIHEVEVDIATENRSVGHFALVSGSLLVPMSRF
jgi:hypothetical protein